jgi:nitrile hydratase subunit beta
MRTPKFSVGQRVRVRAVCPPGHIRTPYYTRGRVGTIASLAGIDPNPEHLAYSQLDQPPVPVYRVRFRQPELWPDYSGNSHTPSHYVVTRGASAGRSTLTLDFLDLSDGWLHHLLENCGNNINRLEVYHEIRGNLEMSTAV